MAVGYDNSAAVRDFSVTTATTPSFTIGGSDRAGLLQFILHSTSVSGISGSIGGASCSAVAGTQQSVNNKYQEIWGCVNPATGSQTGTLSWTTATNVELGAITFVGANQSGGSSTFNNGNAVNHGFGTGGSIQITSSSGDLTTTCCGPEFGSGNLVTSDQTDRWAASTLMAGDTGPGTGTTTHVWTGVDSDNYSSSGCNVAAAATGPTPITGSDTMALVLSESSALRQLLASADALTVQVVESSAIAINFTASESIAVGVGEASSIAINLSGSDTLVIGLSESVALLIALLTGESIGPLLEDPSILSQQIVTGESCAAGLTELAQAVTATASSDTVALGLTDATQALLAALTREESLTLAWGEAAALYATLQQSEAIPLPLVEQGSVAVAITSAGDSLTITLDEAGQQAINVVGTDAVQAILSESSTLFAQLAREESIPIALTDAVDQIVALLQSADITALLVVEDGRILQPITSADEAMVRLSDVSSLSSLSLDRFGSILVATVKRVSPVRTVRLV